jgi:hypothetical protein
VGTTGHAGGAAGAPEVLSIVDKKGSLADMWQNVSPFLKHLRIFWMLAILLMAGGQLLHAQEQFLTTTDHVHCSHDSRTDDCATDAGCCHLHSSTATVATEIPRLAAIQTLSHYLVILDETCLEGPRRDIDYPPQLS